jgi:hypothetical protein
MAHLIINVWFKVNYLNERMHYLCLEIIHTMVVKLLICPGDFYSWMHVLKHRVYELYHWDGVEYTSKWINAQMNECMRIHV